MTGIRKIPTARRIAKANGETVYFTGKPCRYGHITQRLVSNRACVECSKISTALWRKKSPRFNISLNKWRANNKERIRALNRARYARDPEHAHSFVRKWRKRNPSRINEYSAKRLAQELKATPEWADKQLIKDIYMESKYQGLHVDHMVPLRGKNVCGLHVEHNLQLLTLVENSKKNNHFSSD